MKPFKAWLLVDDKGTYSPAMFVTRREAQAELRDHKDLIDAKWRIVRVTVRKADRGRASG